MGYNYNTDRHMVENRYQKRFWNLQIDIGNMPKKREKSGQLFTAMETARDMTDLYLD